VGCCTTPDECTRYRAELLAILTSLEVLDNVTKNAEHHGQATIECSHRRAIEQAVHFTPLGVKMATQANYDIILAIRQLRSAINVILKPMFLPVCPRTMQQDTTSDGHTYSLLSLSSSIITVIRDGVSMVEDLRKDITKIAHSEALHQKIKKDNGWTEDQSATVDWDSYYAAIRGIPRSHQISITKLSHQLWNMNRQNNRYYKQSAVCHACQTSEELISRIFTLARKHLSLKFVRKPLSHLHLYLPRSLPPPSSTLFNWEYGIMYSPPL
jgi:hypothetical protein